MPTRLLRISSKDRNANSTGKYNLTFSTNDYDLHQARTILLKSAIIPNTQYNINLNNNTMTYRIGVDLFSIVIPIGQYTIETFITAIELAGSDLGLSIFQSPLTGKLTLTTTTAIQWLAIDLNPMATVLGIEYHDIVDALVKECQNLPNLSGLQHLYIASNALSNNTSMITEDKNKINVFAEIPITVPFGFLQVVSNDSSTMDRTDLGSLKNISTIDIKLLDVNNRVVDLNGADFTLIFTIGS